MLTVGRRHHLDGMDTIGVALHVEGGDLTAPARRPIGLCPNGINAQVQVFFNAHGVADEVAEIVAATDYYSGFAGIVRDLLEVAGFLLRDNGQLIEVLVLHPDQRAGAGAVDQ